MKTNIHKMAGTPAGNGQLIIPELRNTSKKVASRRKKGTADPNAQSNTGINIYNPFTGRYVGDKQYSKIRHEAGCDFKLLDRNSHITGWNGTLSEEEFIALPESQIYLMGKNMKADTLEDAERLLEVSLEEHILSTDSNGYDVPDHTAEEAGANATSHTAGMQSSVFTAEPDEVIGDGSFSELYNVCINQSKDIDKLEAQILSLERQATKDTDLMEEMYHAGRKAIVKMDSIIDRIGSELGINPPPF